MVAGVAGVANGGLDLQFEFKTVLYIDNVGEIDTEDYWKCIRRRI